MDDLNLNLLVLASFAIERTELCHKLYVAQIYELSKVDMCMS